MNNTRTGATYVALPEQSRSIIRRSAACFTGYLPSHKLGNDRRLIGCEGTLERDFAYLIEDDDSIVSYREQPEPFEWRDASRIHFYTPDFGLLTDTGRRICVEVKPIDEVDRLRLRPIYRILRDAAIDTGRFDEFQLWTDRDIREGNCLTNARLRYSERAQLRESAEGLAVRTAFLRLGGRDTVRRVRDESGLEDRGFRAILRMMAEGACHSAVPEALIEDETIVVWGAD